MIRLQWILLAIVLVGARAASARADEPTGPQAPVSPPSQPVRCKVLHLKIAGELDNTRLGKEFAATAGQLRSDGIEVLVLELGANKWRADVLASMFAAVREAGLGATDSAGETSPGAAPTAARPRWIVWLNDPDDQRVGSAAVALGLLADRCYAAGKIEAVYEPGDDVRSLAPPPPTVDWDQIDQDLRAAVWRRLSQRGGDLLLAAAIPTPRQPLWLTDRAGDDARTGPRVVDHEPAAGKSGAIPLVSREPGGGGGDGAALRLKLTAQTMTALGVAAGQARELGQILASEHVVARTTARRTITSGLADAQRKLATAFAEVDAARERLDHSLDDAEHARGQDAPGRRAKAGQSGVTLADDAIKRLLEAESLTTDYPELLRVMPPGQTSVGATEQRMSAAWVSAFQVRRQALTDLRNRAVRLAQ